MTVNSCLFRPARFENSVVLQLFGPLVKNLCLQLCLNLRQLSSKPRSGPQHSLPASMSKGELCYCLGPLANRFLWGIIGMRLLDIAGELANIVVVSSPIGVDESGLKPDRNE